MALLSFSPPDENDRGRFFPSQPEAFAKSAPARAFMCSLGSAPASTLPLRNVWPFHAHFATVVEGLLERIVIPYQAGTGSLVLARPLSGAPHQIEGSGGSLSHLLSSSGIGDAIGSVETVYGDGYPCRKSFCGAAGGYAAKRFLSADHWLELLDDSFRAACSDATVEINAYPRTSSSPWRVNRVHVLPPALSPVLSGFGSKWTTTSWMESSDQYSAASRQATLSEVGFGADHTLGSAFVDLLTSLGWAGNAYYRETGSLFWTSLAPNADSGWDSRRLSNQLVDGATSVPATRRANLDLLWACQAALGYMAMSWASVQAAWRVRHDYRTVVTTFSVELDGTYSYVSVDNTTSYSDSSVWCDRGVYSYSSGDFESTGTAQGTFKIHMDALDGYEYWHHEVSDVFLWRTAGHITGLVPGVDADVEVELSPWPVDIFTDAELSGFWEYEPDSEHTTDPSEYYDGNDYELSVTSYVVVPSGTNVADSTQVRGEWPHAGAYSLGYVGGLSLAAGERYDDSVKIYETATETPEGGPSQYVLEPAIAEESRPVSGKAVGYRLFVKENDAPSAQSDADTLAEDAVKDVVKGVRAGSSGFAKFDFDRFSTPIAVPGCNSRPARLPPGHHVNPQTGKVEPIDPDMPFGAPGVFFTTPTVLAVYNPTKSMTRPPGATGSDLQYYPYKLVLSDGTVVWEYPDTYIRVPVSGDFSFSSQHADFPEPGDDFFKVSFSPSVLLGAKWSWKAMPCVS